MSVRSNPSWIPSLLQRNVFYSSGAVFLLAGCGGGTEQPTPPPPPPPVVQPVVNTPAPAVTPQGNPAPAVVEKMAPEEPGSEKPAVATPAPAELDISTLASDYPPDLFERIKKTVDEYGYGTATGRLHAISTALFLCQKELDHFPAPDGLGTEANGLSWRVHLLPFLGEAELYQQFRLEEAWDSPANKKLIKKMPKVWGSSPDGKTRVQLFVGEQTPFQAGKKTRLEELSDGEAGAAFTILAVESGENVADIWTKPGGLEFQSGNPSVALGNVGPRFFAIMGDGTIQSVPSKSEHLPGLIQNRDGVAVPPETLVPAKPAVEATARSKSELPPSGPLPEQVDLSYLPENAQTMLIIHPRRILESPVISGLLDLFRPDPSVTARQILYGFLPDSPAGMDQMPGVEMEDFDEIRVVIDLVAAAKNSPQQFSTGLQPGEDFINPVLAASFRYSEPVNVEFILSNFLQNGFNPQLQIEHGYPLISMTSFDQVVSIPDSHRSLIGQKDTIQQMLKAAKQVDADTPLAKMLKERGNSDIVMGMIKPEGTATPETPAEPAANPLLGAAPAMPKFDGDVWLAISFQSADLLKLQYASKNPQQDQGSLTAGLAGLQFLGTSMLMSPDGTPGENLPFVTLIQSLHRGAVVTATDKEVHLKIATPPEFHQLPKLLAPLLKQLSPTPEIADGVDPLSLIGLAILKYSTDRGYLPKPNGPGSQEQFDDPKKHTGLSWRVHLLPFIGHQSLYNQFHLDERWDSEHNKELLKYMPDLFGDSTEGKTRVHLITGGNTLYPLNRVTTLAEMTDDPEMTVLVVEAGPDKADFWTKPGGLPMMTSDPIKTLGRADNPEGNFRVVTATGETHTLHSRSEGLLLRSLVHPSDGKPSKGGSNQNERRLRNQ